MRGKPQLNYCHSLRAEQGAIAALFLRYTAVNWANRLQPVLSDKTPICNESSCEGKCDAICSGLLSNSNLRCAQVCSQDSQAGPTADAPFSPTFCTSVEAARWKRGAPACALSKFNNCRWLQIACIRRKSMGPRRRKALKPGGRRLVNDRYLSKFLLPKPEKGTRRIWTSRAGARASNHHSSFGVMIGWRMSTGI